MAKSGERFKIKYTIMLADESVQLTASEIRWICGITIQILLSFLSACRACQLKTFFKTPCG